VKIVLGTLELTTIGGVGTYLVTVAEQLERIGHDVAILGEERGAMAEIAAERGLDLAEDPAELPDRCDIVYAQDAPSAYRLAQRYGDVPQVFCAHAPDHERWMVPQLPGVTSAVVALHGRAARHARSLAHAPEVVRLRQPVDIRRFSPRGAIAEVPRRALLLGNHLSGNRLELIRAACAGAGIELVERGLRGGDFAVAPEAVMNDGDLVIGKSRVIVEAMACGRAAYVYDHHGGDGWVTPERYPALEADNFDGQSDPEPADAARLRDDLLSYRAQMGAVNRELAVTHHSARSHCEDLVELFRRLAPRGESVGAPLDELGRLTRMQWRADARALGFEHEAQLLRAELSRRNRESAELAGELARARADAAEAELRGKGMRQALSVRALPFRALRKNGRPSR
jgi:hypothetical protein